MSSAEAPATAWWREERRRRNDPEERTADRAAQHRRLFGDPDEPEPVADQADDGPDPA